MFLFNICGLCRNRSIDTDDDNDDKVDTEVADEKDAITNTDEVDTQVQELKVLVNNLQERVDSLDDELYIVKKSLLLSLKINETSYTPKKYTQVRRECSSESDSSEDESTEDRYDDFDLELDEDEAEERELDNDVLKKIQ